MGLDIFNLGKVDVPDPEKDPVPVPDSDGTDDEISEELKKKIAEARQAELERLAREDS